jgi:hypothetical protein
MVATLDNELDVSLAKSGHTLCTSACETSRHRRHAAYRQLRDRNGSPRTTGHILIVILRGIAVFDLSHLEGRREFAVVKVVRERCLGNLANSKPVKIVSKQQESMRGVECWVRDAGRGAGKASSASQRVALSRDLSQISSAHLDGTHVFLTPA